MTGVRSDPIIDNPRSAELNIQVQMKKEDSMRENVIYTETAIPPRLSTEFLRFKVWK